MALEIVTIPCLSDNYAFLLHDVSTGQTAVVDVPEAGPIKKALTQRGWGLTDILITHHHHDHIGGVEELRDGCRVWGAKADRHRLPPLDHAIEEGDSVVVGSEAGFVLDVSGHTVGHIAFHFPESRAVFTADSLMAMGCGRLFEGDARMMWASLAKLAALPADTIVCSGHEYTTQNAAFAVTVDPDNAALADRVAAIGAARSRGEPTVPSLLSDELATNPFLRGSVPEVKAALGMQNAQTADVFAEIRRLKDDF